MELVERLRARVKIETSCGNRTESPHNHVRLMDEAADALTTLRAREATLITLVGDAAAYIRELARMDTMILAEDLEKKADELSEALATSDLAEGS